jgi:hypothetical protein
MLNVLEPVLPVPPGPSPAVQVTSVTPIGKVEPDAGAQTTGTDPATTSDALALKVTTAPLGPVGWTVMLAGTVTVGGVVSWTVTVKLLDPTFVPSVAVHVIVVTPIGNNDPDVGDPHVAGTDTFVGGSTALGVP